MDSFIWGGNDDVTCLVRSSNQSTFGNLQLKPPVVWPSPDTIESSKNLTLFEQQWEEMVNRTLKAATKAETSSALKVPAPPPRPRSQEKQSCITEKKVGSAEYSDSDGQFMLRFDLGMILMATDDFSSENTLGQGGFGTVYKTWKRWVEGKPEIIIDPLLIENPRNEIVKLIQIGLLCVQENATKRPTMSSVLIWLGSETIIIPLPKAPAFTWSRSQSESGAMSMSDDVFTELSCR
ncbi:unnamed protein product [Arabidopsis arenosa]|uniref:Uncharacterized protein n=1 Tax=Arabidopsis arenosa TaxID=38785 RepID=A0A8S2AL29_ARAAE|nr:unnamed protein product [Arabidopsis arenosa]